MAAVSDEIHNPRTGQRMRFLPPEPAGEDVLRIESVNPPGASFEPTHVHPRQESRARAISGELVFVVDGNERRIGPGEEIVIPAGVPHTFRNADDADALSVQEFRPALRIEGFFRTYFALAERGELGEAGMPSLLRLAVLVPEYSDEIRATKPPWWVQRTTFALLRPIARLRGYSVAGLR